MYRCQIWVIVPIRNSPATYRSVAAIRLDRAPYRSPSQPAAGDSMALTMLRRK